MKGLAEIDQEGGEVPYPRPIREPGEPSYSVPSSTADWVNQINNIWARGPANTIDLATIVARARSRLPHGEWSDLCKSGRLPFSKRKGEMLAGVGVRLGWVNAQMFAHLPSGWSVLYQLSWIGRPALERFVGDGTIHPKLTLREAKELVAKFSARRPGGGSRGTNVKQRVAKFKEFVGAALKNWSPGDRKLVRRELLQIVELIDTHEKNSGLDPISNTSLGSTTVAGTSRSISFPPIEIQTVPSEVKSDRQSSSTL